MEEEPAKETKRQKSVESGVITTKEGGSLQEESNLQLR